MSRRPWRIAYDDEVLADVAQLRDEGVKCPPGLVRTWLRVHQDRTVAGLGTFPSARDAADAVGWSKSSMHRLLLDWRSWTDPALERAWEAHLRSEGLLTSPHPARGTPLGQERDSGGTPSGQPTQDEPAESARDGTGAGRARDSGGTVVDTRADLPTTDHRPPTEKHTPPSPPRQEERPTGACVDPPPGPVPGWARSVAPPRGVSRHRLVEAVVRCVREVEQREVEASAVAPQARQVVRLWRELGLPELEAFADDVALVARACRESGAEVFARHVRGVGWKGKRDASRSVRTVTDPERWPDRLQAAKAWAAKRPGTVGPPRTWRQTRLGQRLPGLAAELDEQLGASGVDEHRVVEASLRSAWGLLQAQLLDEALGHHDHALDAERPEEREALLDWSWWRLIDLSDGLASEDEHHRPGRRPSLQVVEGGG